METARLSYTSVTDYMSMTVDDFICFRMALVNVLDREKSARENNK